MKTTKQILLNAKEASKNASALTTEIKNTALLKMADELENNAERILRANQIDLQNAKGVLPEVMLDRLRLDEKRIQTMANGIREVASLPDPIGKVLSSALLPNALKLRKVSVPLGVIAIIYESRPNVTSDAGALCFKSGSACVLRGGKDAFHSSFAIVQIMRESLKAVGVDENFINIVEDTSRESATQLMTASGLVDALIPRGGAGLIRSCVENAKVPCIQTGTGICHIYIDESADIDKAIAIVDNAKTSRPSVCNAVEVCLVHEKIAPKFLPLLGEKFKGRVQLRCDKTAFEILGSENCVLASETDFDTEFLDYILAVKIVAGVDEAIAHIAKHSTGHSEAVITQTQAVADKFVLAVDSSAVYVNASTRFTDGGEFGKGCEIGISTQKLHARGPMGLEEICSYKYIVEGDGQIR